MDTRILTATEVAEILRVDRQRIYELTRRNLLPHIRVAERQYRYSQDAIQHWIANGGNQNITKGEK